MDLLPSNHHDPAGGHPPAAFQHEHPIHLRAAFWTPFWFSTTLGLVSGLVLSVYGWVKNDVANGYGFSRRLDQTFAAIESVGWMIIAVTIGLSLIYFRIGCRIDKSLREMESGKFLVRFTYADDVWLPWIDLTLGRPIKQLILFLPSTLLAAPIFIWLGLKLFRVNPNSVQETRTIVIVVVAVLSLVEAIAALALTALICTRLRYLRDPPAVCYISKSAIFLQGSVILFDTYFAGLENAQLIRGTPSFLAFQFITRQTRSNRGRRKFRIPIPTGREALAEKAIEALMTRHSGLGDDIARDIDTRQQRGP